MTTPPVLPFSGAAAGIADAFSESTIYVRNKLANLTSGVVTVDQREYAIAQCAADNQKASGGRLTLEQARAQCAKDMNASYRQTDADRERERAGAKRDVWLWAGLGGTLLFAVWMSRR